MFTITITETKTVEKEVDERWQQINQEGEYGYPPRRVSFQQVSREVLKQEVETLDVPAVIKAINNL